METEEEKPVKGGALAQMREEDNRTIKEFLDALAGTPNLELVMHRLKPEVWEGKDIKGTVDRYEEPVTEDQIREKHGGGTYKIYVRAPNGPGNKKGFSTTRIFTISGPPKPEGVGYAKNSGEDDAKPQSASVVQQAMQMTSSMARDAQARADRAEREMRANTGFDPEMLRMMNAPLLAQIEAMQEDKRETERRLEALMNHRPDNSFQERMLERLTDQDGARITALREQHHSELREVRETNKQDMLRLHESYKEQLKNAEQSRNRELDNLKLSYEGRIETLKASYEMRIDGLKSDLVRQERDLTKVETEAATLRAKKEKPLTEQLQEFADLKDNMDSVFGKDEPEPEEKKDFLDKVFDNPLTQSIAQRIATGAPEAAAAPAAPAAPTGLTPQQQYEQALIAAAAKIPVGKAFRLKGDNQAWMRTATGQIVPVALKTTAAPKPAPAAPADIGVGPDELAFAMGFIESALAAGTTPQEFAASAVTMVPPGVKKALKEHGSDWLLAEVVKPGEASPLSTQRGKTWFREVAAELLKIAP